MAPTPKLYTSELSAHYGRLWKFAELLLKVPKVRKYPIVLHLISLAQVFADWAADRAELMAYTLDIDFPNRKSVYPLFGADPLVGDHLDFIGNELGNYTHEHPELGFEVIGEVIAWHKVVLQRTNWQTMPSYLSTKPCIKCEEYSIIKTNKTYICLNRECEHSWVRK